MRDDWATGLDSDDLDDFASWLYLDWLDAFSPPRPPQTNRTGVSDLAPNARPIAAGQALPPHGGSLAGRSGVES